MTKRWLLLAVIAQGLVLAWIAGEREWILRTGETVFLRTAPVDPRDLFRGDYVRLQYEINSVRREGAAPPAGERRRHEVVHTRLRPVGEGLFEAAGSSRERPSEGIFLRGRIEDDWRMGWRGGAHQAVKYGIEKLFVEQGSGKAIEKYRGGRDDLQVPMEVEVAVGASGTAVIRGYRWSRLGIKLETLRRPAPRDRNAAPPVLEGPPAPLSPRMVLTLANVSAAPLALVDSDAAAGHCGLRLVPVAWAGEPYPPASPAPDCAGVPGAEVISLAPGQSYSVDLDLSAPRWHVLAGGKPLEIGALPGMTQFRLEYLAPPAAAATGEAGEIWRGRLASPAFNANGIID